MTAFSIWVTTATPLLWERARKDGPGDDGGNELYGSVSHGTDYVLAYTRPSAGNYASAKLFINGTEQTRASGGNDTGSPTSTTANFKIGSNYNGGGNFINGYIGEIIVIESDSKATVTALKATSHTSGAWQPAY